MKIAASLICSQPLSIDKDLDELIKGKTDYIHFDVMDGHFVSRYGLYPEILTALKQRTNILVDVHMMVSNAEDYIQLYKDAGADYYNVHIESTNQIHRCIAKVKNSGMKAGIAMNPATPINALDWVINDIEMVVLMAINPGIVGHKVIPSIINKTKALREYAIAKGNPNLLIEIDGGVTFETAPKFIEAGADILVCGTGTIFRPQEDTISNKIQQLRNLFN